MHRAKHFPQVLCTRKKHLSSVNGSRNRFVLLLHLPPHLHPPLLVFLFILVLLLLQLMDCGVWCKGTHRGIERQEFTVHHRLHILISLP